MSVIGKLFGSEKVIDSAANGIDKVFFTNQEKSEQWLDTLKAYEPFKLAQRLIALIVTIAYVSVWLICAILMVLGMWLDTSMELSKTLAEWNYNTLGLPFTLILSFYFAGGALEGIVAKFQKSKTKKE